jgi:hypothetical protein
MSTALPEPSTVTYHEIMPESLNEVLRQGIKRGTHGEKSNSDNENTDSFLDAHLAKTLAAQGVSRQNVVYGYLASGDKLVDIRNGELVDVKSFTAEREQLLLRILVPSSCCFVSDLDAYDAVKVAIGSNLPDIERQRRAEQYWRRVIPLTQYEGPRIRRPELMITCDIQPAWIDVVA